MNFTLFRNITKQESDGTIRGLKINEEPQNQFTDDTKKLRIDFNNFTKKILQDNSWQIHNVDNTWQHSGYYKQYFWNQIRHNEFYIDGISLWIAIREDGIRLQFGTTDTYKGDDRSKINKEIFEKYNYLNFEQFQQTNEWEYLNFLYIGEDCSKDIEYFKKAIKVLCEKYIEYIKQKKGIQMPEEINLKTKNIILYGAPGVGKTHNTNKLINLIDESKSEKEIFSAIKDNKNETITLNDDLKSRVKFITFHQSFGYEDFIEGFRPNKEGNIKIEKGIFHNICTEAIKEENKDKNYYLVIDEINRGNISKIFGELITLIEDDKRDKIEVTLPYSKEPFKVPSNLFIIGTMNSTDKSIALIDIALRRRFTFLKMKPNEILVPDIAKSIFSQINQKISETIGEDYKIGHSYFMNISNEDDLNFVLEYKITPLLEEYFYGNKEQLDQVLEIIKG
ncbi:MAG: AAA family ATPase [Arcobacteraceae bacterium]|jgi:5-methylcytosine-specific restriction endonuclease McrBC GTP-binding regulatory subunit McrB|nr:AAA family ATPase [Arcobacteraceae bacterium]